MMRRHAPKKTHRLPDHELNVVNNLCIHLGKWHSTISGEARKVQCHGINHHLYPRLVDTLCVYFVPTGNDEQKTPHIDRYCFRGFEECRSCPRASNTVAPAPSAVPPPLARTPHNSPRTPSPTLLLHEPAVYSDPPTHWRAARFANFCRHDHHYLAMFHSRHQQRRRVTSSRPLSSRHCNHCGHSLPKFERDTTKARSCRRRWTPPLPFLTIISSSPLIKPARFVWKNNGVVSVRGA